jgi:TP901 family phage tail tape measure protein
MPDTTSHDLVVIEIRGEKAQITLEELRNLFVSLQTAATQTGETVDAAMTALALPIEQIAQNTGIAVTELQNLRAQLAGMAGVAGAPGAAAAGIRDMGAAAREARMAIGGGAIVPGYGATGAQMVSGMTQQDVVTIENYRKALETTGEVTDDVTDKTTRWNASFRRHIVWFAQGTVIYYAINTAMGAVSDQIEGLVDDLLAYDQAMAQMRYITSEATGDLDNLTESAIAVGTIFGQMPTEVYEGLVGITQATKDSSEQVAYAADAAKLAFVANQEYGESLDQLIAIERVWGMEASEGQRILDIAATSYRVAKIPLDEFINTMERGGKIAESVGWTFEEYAAVIAAVGEYSDLTESQVTTLMERISARPFQSDLAQRFQREFGFLNIELFEPGTAQTQRREVSAILEDLIVVWDQLTASQRQAVAEIFAGSRQASEFLTLMESLKRVPDYIDEYSNSLGESNRLTGELMNTITAQKDAAIAAFADMRHEIALLGDEVLGVTSLFRDMGVAWSAMATLMRTARGEPAEGLTEEETLRQRLTQIEEAIAEAKGERGFVAQQLRLTRGFGGITSTALQNPEAMTAWLEQMRTQYRARLAEVTVPETLRTADFDLMGQMDEYRSALEESAEYAKRQHQEMLSEEQAFQQRMAEVMRGEYATGVDAWVSGLENVSNILDLTELNQEQINQAQQDSRDMAMEIYEAYVAQAEELAGTELTWEQQKAIWDAMVEQWAATVILIRNARGELEVITGLEAAFLDDTTEALQAEKERFNIQRLSRIQPQQFEQLQQMAWQWQAYLGTLPGYDEEARQFYVVLADNVARPITTTSTALRYAIEDLTEVEKRQLEGMWNLPAGVTAYVPITSLFYQQQATGAPGGTPMTGPPWTGSRIDTTPVDLAIGNLSEDLFTAADSTMNFAEAAAAAMLMIQEAMIRASILTPERRTATELALEEYTTRTSILTPERRTELEQSLQENPWAGGTVNINLTSQLYLNQTLLAQTMQQLLGVNLTNSARGYGLNAGGNAPPVMI